MYKEKHSAPSWQFGQQSTAPEHALHHIRIWMWVLVPPLPVNKSELIEKE